MEELKNIAPRLHQLPKKDNFVVPEDYFDELPGLIQNKIVVKPTSYLVSSLKYALPLLLIVISVVYFTNSSSNNIIQISEKEAVEYVNHQVDSDFDETLLAEEISIPQDDIELKDSPVEEYLLDEVDEKLLIEEI